MSRGGHSPWPKKILPCSRINQSIGRKVTLNQPIAKQVCFGRPSKIYKYKLSLYFFPAFYGQRSVAEVWINPSLPWLLSLGVSGCVLANSICPSMVSWLGPEILSSNSLIGTLQWKVLIWKEHIFLKWFLTKLFLKLVNWQDTIFLGVVIWLEPIFMESSYETLFF